MVTLKEFFDGMTEEATINPWETADFICYNLRRMIPIEFNVEVEVYTDFQKNIKIEQKSKGFPSKTFGDFIIPFSWIKAGAWDTIRYHIAESINFPKMVSPVHPMQTPKSTPKRIDVGEIKPKKYRRILKDA